MLWEGMIDEDVRALWEPWMEELTDRVTLRKARGTGTAPREDGRRHLPNSEKSIATRKDAESMQIS